jgi:hypothetical protein
MQIFLGFPGSAKTGKNTGKFQFPDGKTRGSCTAGAGISGIFALRMRKYDRERRFAITGNCTPKNRESYAPAGTTWTPVLFALTARAALTLLQYKSVKELSLSKKRHAVQVSWSHSLRAQI